MQRIRPAKQQLVFLRVFGVEDVLVADANLAHLRTRRFEFNEGRQRWHGLLGDHEAKPGQDQRKNKAAHGDGHDVPQQVEGGGNQFAPRPCKSAAPRRESLITLTPLSANIRSMRSSHSTRYSTVRADAIGSSALSAKNIISGGHLLAGDVKQAPQSTCIYIKRGVGRTRIATASSGEQTAAAATDSLSRSIGVPMTGQSPTPNPMLHSMAPSNTA